MATLDMRRAEVARQPLDAVREELVRQVTLDLLPTTPTLDPQSELTLEQAAALESGGFSLEPLTLGTPSDPVKRTIAAYVQLLATSLSQEEAARRLGVSPSRIRQRLGARTLYGIKWQRHWRLPRFQFTPTGALPGIAAVLPNLNQALHPLGVATWFTEPDPDLLIGDTPVSPQDWLAAGQSPTEVAAIAADL